MLIPDDSLISRYSTFLNLFEDLIRQILTAFNFPMTDMISNYVIDFRNFITCNLIREKAMLRYT